MYTNSHVYPQLSGQVAFQLLEEGAGYGLYNVSKSGNSVTLSATAKGGAADLATQFAKAAGEPLNPIATEPVGPTDPPTQAGSDPVVDITWPDKLLPLKTFTSADATITVENYATVEVQITQGGQVMGSIAAAASGTQPTRGSVAVAAGVALSMQGHNGQNWDAICGLPAASVKDSITVKNDIAWGPDVVCPPG